MASAFSDTGDMTADPENRYLWRFRPQRLEAEIVRDNMLAVPATSTSTSAANRFFLTCRGILASQSAAGRTRRTEPGVAARGLRYQRCSLPYPMFDTFDHPDMNVTAGAGMSRRCQRRRSRC